MSDWRLIEGDCLDVLRDMPDASVDALITDPPFGIGFQYGDQREDTNDPRSYWDWLRPRYEEAVRCVHPGGLVAVWQAQLYFRHFWDWFGDDIHIYCAGKNFVQLRKVPINYGYDPIVMFYKVGALPLCPTKGQGGSFRNVDFFVANTAAAVCDPRRLERAHPCPRPLDQAREIVRNFTQPGSRVLDPFVGSGTTGVAALQEGRSFVGIEREAEYVAIARARLEAASARPRLDLAI